MDREQVLALLGKVRWQRGLKVHIERLMIEVNEPLLPSEIFKILTGLGLKIANIGSVYAAMHRNPHKFSKDKCGYWSLNNTKISGK